MIISHPGDHWGGHTRPGGRAPLLLELKQTEGDITWGRPDPPPEPKNSPNYTGNNTNIALRLFEVERECHATTRSCVARPSVACWTPGRPIIIVGTWAAF